MNAKFELKFLIRLSDIDRVGARFEKDKAKSYWQEPKLKEVAYDLFGK